MTDRLTTLLHAVLAHPEYDVVRLVYADALEEAGDGERAEFIRVQVALAKHDVSIECLTPEDCYYSNRCKKECGCEERDAICEQLRKRNKELSDNCFDWFADATTPGGSCHWERGFVSSVRCSLAAWCGEECERCSGPDYDGPSTSCKACHGTGRTPGHGAEIVARHPVERVEFTDREPADRTSVNDRWYWFREYLSPSALNNYLPPELFEMLSDFQPEILGVPYGSRESALTALSAAAIRWARAEAVRRGLVPDVWETPKKVASNYP